VSGQLQPGQIVTVWKSKAIPSAPLVISDRLPLVLRQQLTVALQSKANADYLRANGFCQGKWVISDGDAYGYQPADDAFYNGICEICKGLQNGPCTEG
jgi:phosphonate transport system substrate-binding protein